MTTFVKRSFTALATTSILALSATAATADTWRYAFEEAIEDVQGVFATKFKEEVEANTDHTVQLFPYGTLGESADTMEQAQAGILQFVDQSPGFTGSLIPEAQVFFVPAALQRAASRASVAKSRKKSHAPLDCHWPSKCMSTRWST